MKRIALSSLLLIICVCTSAQTVTVLSAFQDMQRGYLKKAKIEIDAACKNEDTKEDAQTWCYAGLIYSEIGSSPKHNSLAPDWCSIATIALKRCRELDKKKKYKNECKKIEDAIKNQCGDLVLDKAEEKPNNQMQTKENNSNEDTIKNHRGELALDKTIEKPQNQTQTKENNSKKESGVVSEVSLLVSADGPTKNDAINNALRSAIEQTFGTFVSANTEILNDELVKDDIATVSSGNIQKYSEVASITLPNGNTSVTLNVTVSLTKLVSYAQSKGSECEFAGATFGANLRMYEFNKKNEKIAVDNLIKQLNSLRPIFDYSISVSDPIINDPNWPKQNSYHMDVDKSEYATVKITVKYNENKATKQFLSILTNTFNSLAKTFDEISPLQKSGFKFYKYNVGYLINPLPDDLYYLLDIVKYDFVIEDNNNTRYIVYGNSDWIDNYVDIHWPDWVKENEENKYKYRENADITNVSPCSWNKYGIRYDKKDCNSNTVLHNVPFVVPLNDIQTISQIRVTPALEQRTPYIFINETRYEMWCYINEPILMLKESDASLMSIYRNSKSIQPDFERFLDDELKKSTIPILTEKQLKYDDTHKNKNYGWYMWPNE